MRSEAITGMVKMSCTNDYDNEIINYRSVYSALVLYAVLLSYREDVNCGCNGTRIDRK